jgi:hypothetical protein
MALALGFVAIICFLTQPTPINGIVPTLASVALFSIALKRNTKMNLKELELSSER